MDQRLGCYLGSAGKADQGPQVHLDSTTRKCGIRQLCGSQGTFLQSLSSILLPVHLVSRRIELEVKSKKGFRKSVKISKEDAHNSNCHPTHSEGLPFSFSHSRTDAKGRRRKAGRRTKENSMGKLGLQP